MGWCANPEPSWSRRLRDCAPFDVSSADLAAKQRGIEVTAWGVPPSFEVPDVVAAPDVAAGRLAVLEELDVAAAESLGGPAEPDVVVPEWLDELADLGAAVPVWLGELAEPDAAVPG
jgi:hypothetical protein